MSWDWDDDKVREGELTAKDFRLTRAGDWYSLWLDGRVIKRRLSRANIVGAEVWFWSFSSPRDDRTRDNIRIKATQWVPEGTRPTRPNNHRSNLIYVPLET